MAWFARTALAFFVVMTVCYSCRIASAQDHPWDPPPDKAAIMVVNAHPDDEGIFFGGTIPYYSQVRELPLILVDMVSNAFGSPPEIREEELRNAAWIYGMRNEPLFVAAPDVNTAGWDDYNQWGGTDYAVELVAERIRRFQPDVILTHDFDGEYGHAGHRETATVVRLAFDVAADVAVDLGGLAPWQAQKLYIHQSEANGLGTPGYTFENWLFHDYLEQTTIDTDGNDLVDSTPRDVADEGLNAHVSQGSPDVSTVYRTGENFDGHHSEWWGLYASTVGPDNLAAPFEIEGTVYTDWSRGDFLQHIDLSGYFQAPGEPGDVNLDGIVSGDGTGPFETDDVTAFVLGWGTTGHLSIDDKWIHGDMTLDGFTNLLDWHVLRTHHPDGDGLDLDSLLGVPEPSAIGLLASCAALLWWRRWRFTGTVTVNRTALLLAVLATIIVHAQPTRRAPTTGSRSLTRRRSW